MSPLLAPASSSLYDEFYPWRGEDFADAYCKREYPDSMPLPTKTTPTFNEDFEYRNSS
jgi:hypothetical protein